MQWLLEESETRKSELLPEVTISHQSQTMRFLTTLFILLREVSKNIMKAIIKTQMNFSPPEDLTFWLQMVTLQAAAHLGP